jgi:GR25 family glycosyltransferase involved in LPS biosynthesis
LGPSSKERKGLLIFEDDVIVARGWETRLHDTVRELEVTNQGGFVLALYTAYPFTPAQGHFYAPYPAKRFFGTQAMYYPEAIRRGFSEYLRANGVDRHVLPYDLLLRAYVQSHGISLYATVPSLAQHVGEISTGLGGPSQGGHFSGGAVEAGNAARMTIPEQVFKQRGISRDGQQEQHV